MRLSEDVRAELAAIEPRKPCCRLAELSALVRGAGTVHLRGGGRIGVHLEVASGAVARRAFSLLRSYGVECEIRTYKRRAFERGTRFQIHLEDDARALQVLNEAGILDSNLAPLAEPPRRVVARTCCRAAYLRGAFLASGSASGPRNAHLELRAADADAARFLAGLAAVEGFSLGVHERESHALAYAKGRETIGELLAFLGAHGSALALGEEAVVSATRARANRLANADHAKSSARAGPRTRSSAPSADWSGRGGSTSSRRSSRRSRGSASAIRRCRSASWRGAAARRRPRRPRTAGWPSSSVSPSFETRRLRREKMRAGRRGSSEDDLPLRFEPRSRP